MIIGDPNTLAIESEIDQVFDTPTGRRALGFFCVHVGGFRYGVKESDATMLGNSVDEVGRRIADRGNHIAPFAREDAFTIAKAFRRSVDGECVPGEMILGVDHSELCSFFYKHNLVWAPDGDEAFDDGSYILQFDVGDDARIIAFQTNDSGEPIRTTLTDATIPQERYYALLRAWLTSFESQLAALRTIH